MNDTFYIISRGYEGKALTPAQRKSSLFAEEPVVLGKILRRGSQPMRLTPAEYETNKVRLHQLEAAGAIKITPPVDSPFEKPTDEMLKKNQAYLAQMRAEEEAAALAALEADNKAKAEADLKAAEEAKATAEAVAAEELKMQLKMQLKVAAEKANEAHEAPVVPTEVPAPPPPAPKAAAPAVEEAAEAVADVVPAKHSEKHDKKSHSSKKGKG